MKTAARVYGRTIRAIAVLAALSCFFLWGLLPGAMPVQGQARPKAGTEKPKGQTTEEGAKAGTAGASFDEAVDSFYSGSGVLTDEQILEAAEAMRSDADELYSALGPDAAKDVEAALTAYEKAKADYLTAAVNGEDVYPVLSTVIANDGIKAVKEDGITGEWNLQGRYARLMIAEGSAVREMIPRFRVKTCAEEDGVLKLGIEEWMTQGYGAKDGTGPVNASAYTYDFSLSLSRDEKGVWTPCAINGTEVNFTWFEEGQDPLKESEEAPAALYAVRSDLDRQVHAYARIADEPFDDGKDSDEKDGSEKAVGGKDGSVKAVDEKDGDEKAVGGKDGSVKDGGNAAGALRFLTDGDEPLCTPSADAMLYDGSGDAGLMETGSIHYSASKAADYADKYWSHYNRKYVEYRGVDCANFVSQCLYAGGMPKTGDWYPQSVNWINVMGHIRHFKSYGSFLTASNSNVKKGNPVYYDWNGNGVYDHTAICVGKNSSGMPVVDAHTNNVYHVPWSMGGGGRRGTISLRANSHSSSSDSSSSHEDKPSKNTWETSGGKVYYRDSNGKKVKSTFMTIKGKRYYFNSSGERVTGMFKVDGHWYYASVKDGYLLRGWQKIGGYYYYFYWKTYRRAGPGLHKFSGYLYYFNNSGQRQVSFIKIGSKWYYADKETGRFIKGWRKIHGEWYYFDKKTYVKAVGWKTIDGQRCRFDSNGILREGKHG